MSAFPEPFHEHVISPAAFPVQADLEAVVRQKPRDLLAGKWAPLIGVEDLQRTLAPTASGTASQQKSVVSVLESRHANTGP
jgi:hypothetical protein